MGEDMGLVYLKGVVGPKALYDMELTGVEYTPTRVRQLGDKQLSKATLVADDDESIHDKARCLHKEIRPDVRDG